MSAAPAASGIGVRAARPEDAAVVAGMMNRLNAHEGLDDTVFSEAKVLEQAFGPDPAYAVLLAELDGAIVGYASHHDFFNTDLAERGVWLVDLFVEEEVRGRGIGRALMAAVARWALAHGRTSLYWGVMPRNRRAWAFYESLGAKVDPGRMMGVQGATLRALARPQED